MEPIFTLPYPEYAIANELGKFFKKSEGYSILIPMSRQQKGFDLIVYNSNTKKSLTIQVKSSRTYSKTTPKRITKNKIYKHYTWFNRFDLKKGDADYYILFGSYVKILKDIRLDHSTDNKKWYNHILLILNDNEMVNFQNNLCDSKFGFCFNNVDEIILNRGEKTPRDITCYRYDKKLLEMKNNLN